MQSHHIIPISLLGDNSKENIMSIDDNLHNVLHRTQNLSSKHIRNFRKNVNGILMPNDYTLDLKHDLRQEYFENAKIEKNKQQRGIYSQVKKIQNINGIDDNINELSLQQLITELIENQKLFVKKILGTF